MWASLTALLYHLSLNPPSQDLQLRERHSQFHLKNVKTFVSRIEDARSDRDREGERGAMENFFSSVFIFQKQIIEGFEPVWEAKGGASKEKDEVIEGKEGKKEREATSTCMTHCSSLLLLCNSSSMSLSHSLSVRSI